MNRTGKPAELEVEGNGGVPGYFPLSGRSISGNEASWGGGSPARGTVPDPQSEVQSGSGATGHGQVINEIEESPASRSEGNDLEALACVVGFHHSKGHNVEWASFPGCDLETQEWKNLAFLALPEGAHKVVGLGYVFFTADLGLGSKDQTARYYGVALYGQHRTEDLVVPELDATRNTVQKSCCVMCREPCFGWMLSSFRPAVELYFEQRDFTRRDVLIAALSGLSANGEECVRCIRGHRQMSPAGLVRRFGRKLLILYKLLLLEQRVVLYSPSCEDVSKNVIALASLVPGLIYSLSPSYQALRATEANEGRRHLTVDTSGGNGLSHHQLLSAHGLPLHVFHRKNRLEPYIPMELMMTEDRRHGGMLAGSSNSLLTSSPPKGLVHVLANCETGSLVVHSTELKAAGHLSAHERTFMDEVTAKVEASDHGGDDDDESDSMTPSHPRWQGSGKWVRAKFEEYTMRMLQAAARRSQLGLISGDVVNKEVMENEMPRMYGQSWIDVWLKSRNYSRWSAEHDLSIAHISRAPKSPAVIGSIKDGFQSSVVDFRNTMRQSVGAKSGIRAAVKARFGSFFGSADVPATSESSKSVTSAEPQAEGGFSGLSLTPRSVHETVAPTFSPPRNLKSASRSAGSSPTNKASERSVSRGNARVARHPNVESRRPAVYSDAEAGSRRGSDEVGNASSVAASLNGSSESDDDPAPHGTDSQMPPDSKSDSASTYPLARSCSPVQAASLPPRVPRPLQRPPLPPRRSPTSAAATSAAAVSAAGRGTPSCPLQGPGAFTGQGDPAAQVLEKDLLDPPSPPPD